MKKKRTKDELLEQFRFHNLMLHTARMARQRVMDDLEADPPVKPGDLLVIPEDHYHAGFAGKQARVRRVVLFPESTDSTAPDRLTWMVYTAPVGSGGPPVYTTVYLPSDYEHPTG